MEKTDIKKSMETCPYGKVYLMGERKECNTEFSLTNDILERLTKPVASETMLHCHPSGSVNGEMTTIERFDGMRNLKQKEFVEITKGRN